MLTKKQIELINEMSNKIFQLEREIDNNNEESNYKAGIVTLLHGIWNDLVAIITFEESLPF